MNTDIDSAFRDRTRIGCGGAATSAAAHDVQGLLHEHRVLLRAYAEAQTRCSRIASAQAAEIERLRAELLRLRATLLVRETARAWALWEGTGAPAAAAAAAPEESRVPPTAPAESAQHRMRLEASLAAADLVICQTGCLSHGAYWRAQDHCRRTGRACALVVQPDDARAPHAAAPPAPIQAG